MDFFRGIKYYVRNPLGIIALFITLIYAVASLLLGITANKISETERWPIIIFIVIFPIIVLFTFYRLVARHHGKLYSPSDYREDGSFLRTLTPEEVNQKLDVEAAEVIQTTVEPQTVQVETRSKDSRVPSLVQLREDIRVIENDVIKMMENEYNMPAMRNVRITNAGIIFDALFDTPVKPTALEIKIMRSPHVSTAMINSLLYNAMLADKYFQSRFKLVVIIVYSVEESLVSNAKSMWKQKLGNTPVDIELRFISNEQLKKSTSE